MEFELDDMPNPVAADKALARPLTIAGSIAAPPGPAVVVVVVLAVPAARRYSADKAGVDG